MDSYTESHLDHWLDCQFDLADIPPLKARMIAHYNLSPDYYGMAGWWRLFDDCGGQKGLIDQQYDHEDTKQS